MFCIFHFFLGFVCSFIGVLPPGLLNMSASKISVRDGKLRAVVFAIGAVLFVFIQTYISVSFARIIDKNAEILILLREIGLVVFTVLTIFFFWTSKKYKPKNEVFKIISKKKSFFQGFILSALNLFPIPYYVFVSVALASYGWFSFAQYEVLSFVAGTGFGSFVVFYLYIVFFKKLEHQTQFILKNMNYIIGSITGILALISLTNILVFYFKK